MRRGFTVEVTSLARARMTPEQRTELYAWSKDRPGVRIFVWRRDRLWETVLTGHDRIEQGRSAESPFASFLAAVSKWDGPALVSVLSDPGAAA